MRLAVPVIFFEVFGVLDPENASQRGGNKYEHDDIKGRHFAPPLHQRMARSLTSSLIYIPGQYAWYLLV
jgi:hypothetical protein